MRPQRIHHIKTVCNQGVQSNVVSVQSLSPVQLCLTPRTAALQVSLSFIISCSLLKLMSIVSIMPSNHLILYRLLLLLPSIFPRIRVFSNGLALCIRWSKFWRVSTSASIPPMNIQDWFPLGLTGLILQSKGLSKVVSSSLILSFLYDSTLTSVHDNWKKS